MTEKNPATVNEVTWQEEQSRIMAIREDVFIREQNVPEEEELDNKDALSTTRHFLLTAAGEVLGYARLLSNNQIGRMAIVQSARKSGYGALLLSAVTRAALQQTSGKPFLHAQVYAMPFYQKMGFKEQGDVFDDAGIPHKTMHLKLCRTTLEKLYGDAVHRLEGAPDFIFHIAQIARNASRHLAIFCSELDSNVWGQEHLVDAISKFARTKRNAQVRILIADSRSLRGTGHPLVKLCQRLTSRLEIRVLNDDAEPPKHAFFNADKRQLVLFNEETSYQGFANYIAPAESQHQLDAFDRLWNYGSSRDPNLAQIVI